MFKRSIACLLIVCLNGLPIISAQNLPAVMMENYEGTAIPHTSSGLINRLIGAVMTEFDLESADQMFVNEEEGESRFQVEIPLNSDGLAVSFSAGESTHEAGFYIYQRIASEEAVDFETLELLVQLVDNSIPEEELQAAYDQWLTDEEGKQQFTLGNYMVDTYTFMEADKEFMAFEIRYEYYDEVFEADGVQNIVTSFYDQATEFPDIYAVDYADKTEEAFVNRVYINRILHELSQTFQFELSEEHLTAMGSTVYYYPQELAEFGRINEFYIFSGFTGPNARIEIRFTLGHNDPDAPGLKNIDHQYRSYFYIFAKLLQPELTDLEIEQALLDSTNENGSEYRLGSIVIQKESYASETISMARLLTAEKVNEVFPNSIENVPEEQQDRVLIAENTYHVASVEQLADPEQIYQPYVPYIRLASGSGPARKEFEELSAAYLNNLPDYKSTVNITGEVISSDTEKNWLKIKPVEASFFDSYHVYTTGENLNLSGIIEVTGQNLGMQHSGGPNLTLIADSIQQEGQVIYQSGGDQNE